MGHEDGVEDEEVVSNTESVPIFLSTDLVGDEDGAEDEEVVSSTESVISLRTYLFSLEHGAEDEEVVPGAEFIPISPSSDPVGDEDGAEDEEVATSTELVLFLEKLIKMDFGEVKFSMDPFPFLQKLLSDSIAKISSGGADPELEAYLKERRKDSNHELTYAQKVSIMKILSDIQKAQHQLWLASEGAFGVEDKSQNDNSA